MQNEQNTKENKDELKKSSELQNDSKVEDEETQAKQQQQNQENEEAYEQQQIQQLKKELEEKTQKCDEYQGLLQRTVAEFDNYRKRTTKEKESLYQDATADTIAQMLIVVDNLQRALDTNKDNAQAEQVLKGVQMVLNQFNECLEKLGVEEIKAIGETFDPEVHNAVMHIEDETVDDNTIIEEFQKGYKLKDRVIRHSMVKVAN